MKARHFPFERFAGTGAGNRPRKIFLRKRGVHTSMAYPFHASYCAA